MSAYTLPQFLKALVDQGASDLHLSPETPPRLRIDGKIYPIDIPPLDHQSVQILCLSVLTDEQKKLLESEKELDISFSVKNLSRFRANIFHQKGMISAAFRVIPYNIKSMDDLGLPKVIRDFCYLPRGLILVTGPTGSGKSTTMASMINEINENRFDHIVTIEDPIEFVHTHKNCVVNQREIGSDTKSFARALKSALRQDPDVVLVGELRDLETIQLALTTAETGHLVFATLHTNSAVSTLNRVIDVFPAYQQVQVRSQLAFNLMGVISQTLVPAEKGGRALAMEILVPHSGIRNLIREDKFHQIYSLMQSGQSQSGMMTLNQSLMDLVDRHIISYEVGLSKSSDAEEFQKMWEKKQNLQSHRNSDRLRKP